MLKAQLWNLIPNQTDSKGDAIAYGYSNLEGEVIR